MTEQQNGGVGRMSRRDAIARVAGAGLGIASILRADLRVASAQGGTPPALPSALNASFPKAPLWDTELKKLAPNVFAYIQAGGPGRGNGGGISNAGAIVGPDRMMAVDTLGQPGQAKAFIAAVRNVTGNKTFERVIHTHHHGDHVVGTQFFLPAEIVSHPFCRDRVLELAAAIPPGARFQPRAGSPDTSTEERKLVAAGTCFTDKMIYYYGDTVVELIHPGIAHTWGDVMVYLPQQKILFAGDVSFHWVVPFSHAGWVTSWLDVVDKVLAMDIDVIVPGHGPLGGKKELAEMGEYYRLLKREAKKRFDTGMSPGKAAADIKMGRFENWVGSERIVLNTFRLYAEFNGTLTPVMDQAGINQAIAEYNGIVKARA